SFSVIYSFCSVTGCPDGAWPLDGLAQGSDGNLYGVSEIGGQNNDGTIFRLGLDGSAYTVLYNFDGANYRNTLLQATDGNFYGTVQQGGAGNTGYIYQLNVGLGPFVKTVPGFGRAGRQVAILVTNLSGIGGVTFGGVPATFSVVSSSEILA